LKNEYIRNYISSGQPQHVLDKINLNPMPESVKLLNSYLTVLGVDYHDA